MAMAAAGLVTAALPVLIDQQGAGAAVTTASQSKFLTYRRDGVSYTCTVTLYATHNTDVEGHPRLEVAFGLDGPPDCANLLASVTESFTDADGVSRTSAHSAGALIYGSVDGAVTNTSVTANILFLGCPSTPSSNCSLTLTASPK
jgi:hypothetical protein